MNYRIYTLTNRFDKSCQGCINEFEKRLSRYCKIKVIPLKKQELVNKYHSANHYNISVTTDTSVISSSELADQLNSLGISGTADISFYINLEIPNPDASLSISPFTIHPDLLTAILCEQIYRSYRIINHQPYHK